RKAKTKQLKFWKVSLIKFLNSGANKFKVSNYEPIHQLPSNIRPADTPEFCSSSARITNGVSVRLSGQRGHKRHHPECNARCKRVQQSPKGKELQHHKDQSAPAQGRQVPKTYHKAARAA